MGKITRGVNMELNDLTDVWRCSDERPPDENTVMIRRIGKREEVGKVFEGSEEDKKREKLSDFIAF